MSDYIVDIRRLVKYRGGTAAVDHVTLTLRRGEFFSILGPSGSGKTTLLRLLAGFEAPDAGAIFIAGQEVAGSGRSVPPHRRPVNLVFQHYALFPHLTVFENVAFGLRMRGVGNAEVREAVGQTLALVRLVGKDDRKPAQLSGGEQQRVALARALVNRPAVLLLDEPLSALDQQLRHEMHAELKTIQEQTGVTFLYVTHHQEEALTMSDRLGVMHQGRLLQVGTPLEVYQAPASEFIAGFVGLSNRLSAQVSAIEGGGCLIVAPGLPHLMARTALGAVTGGPIKVVIRPERLHLSSDAGQEGFDNTLPGRVEKALYTGSEILYLVRLPNGNEWKVRVGSFRGDQKTFSPGEHVYLRWNAAEAVSLVE